MKFNSTFLVSCSALGFAAIASPALADAKDVSGGSSEAAADQSGAEQSGLEDIIVTARRRQETLQSVPIAVTALTSETLTRTNITALPDLQKVTPSLNVTRNPGAQNSALYVLRGQGTGEPNLAVDQAVGTYQDGIYIPRPAGATAAFFDLQRVEVLKGPQGTLFGRNTTGGAINILTRDADLNGWHGYGEGEAGNFGAIKVSAAINVPVVADQLAVRVAAVRYVRDGYGESRITKQRIGGDHNDLVVRGSVLFEPSSNFSVNLKAEYTRQNLNGPLVVPRLYVPSAFRGLTPSSTVTYVDATGAIEAASELGALPPGAGQLVLGGRAALLPFIYGGYTPQQAGAAIAAGANALAGSVAASNADGYYTNSVPYRQYDKYWHAMFSGTITYQLSDSVQVKALTGYRKFQQNLCADQDGTEFRLLDSCTASFSTRPTTKDHFFSQEINLNGSLLDDAIRFVAGGYYSDEAGADITGGFSVPAVNPYLFLNDASSVKSKTWSVYTQNDIRLSKTLTLTAGVRYTEERKSLISTSRFIDIGSLSGAPLTANTGVFTGLGGTPTAIPVSALAGTRYVCSTGVKFASGQNAGFPLVTGNPDACSASQSLKSDGVSYLVSLNYQVTPYVLLYAKTSKGFRGASTQFRDITKPPTLPETATDIELGSKADFLGGRLRVNLAGYRTKYDNISQTVVAPFSSPWLNSGRSIFRENNAKGTIYGFEGEIFARPTPRLYLGASLSYIRGKFDSYPNSFNIFGLPSGDATGQRMPLAPWQYSLSGSYEIPIMDATLTPSVNYSWVSKYPYIARNIDPSIGNLIYDISNTYGGLNSQASLGLLNARLELKVPTQGLNVYAFVTNLTNKRYQTGALTQAFTGGVQTVYPGEPRMFGFGIRKSFGRE